MALNPFRNVWRADPVTIPIPAREDDPLAPLRGSISRFRFSSKATHTCTGIVSGTRVRLSRKPFLSKRAYYPVLDAALRDTPAGPALVGVFRTSWGDRVFITLWLGFVAILAPSVTWAGLQSLLSTGRLGNLVLILGSPLFLGLALRTVLTPPYRWEDEKRLVTTFVTRRIERPRRDAV